MVDKFEVCLLPLKVQNSGKEYLKITLYSVATRHIANFLVAIRLICAIFETVTAMTIVVLRAL